MKITKAELAKKIFTACHLKGNFLLRSGLKSKEYFDKYNMESSPELLSAVVEHLLALIPKQTEILAALEMGGIPIGTALSLRTHLPIRFVRKKAKDYGTKRICEGGPIEGKRLCIIEDVVTTGGQIIESAKQLRAEGAVISEGLCVLFRGDSLENLEKENIKLSYLFDKKEWLDFQNKS